MSNPFDFFEEIYCINLADRTDKWKTCLEEFEKIGIHNRVERLEAIKFEEPHSYANIRAAGCSASQRAAINLIKERNLNNALIFEDDVEFITNTENIYKNLKLSIEELKLQKYWDIFYLGMHVNMEINRYINKEHIPPLERVGANLLKVNVAKCTHAQAYSREAAEIIVSNIPPLHGQNIVPWTEKNDIIDQWILRHMLPRGRSFSTNEFLATQRECFSDINLVIARMDKYFVTEFNKLRPA